MYCRSLHKSNEEHTFKVFLWLDNFPIFPSVTSVQSESSDHHSDDFPMLKELPAKLTSTVGDDNMSEVSNLDAELAISLHVQMAAMLAFAYIWSLGAFVPFKWVKHVDSIPDANHLNDAQKIWKGT